MSKPIDPDRTTREDERPPPDARFGPYRILGEIDKGGMGEVLLAVAVEAAGDVEVGQRVALKRPLPRRDDRDGEARARFHREIALGRTVRHPALVPILDAGEVHDGYGPSLYFAMELVEGRSLRRLLSTDGRLSEPLVRSIGRQLAEGLAALHAEGVVHRDVKPANVLITPDHRVRLADLGMAHVEASIEGLTDSGTAFGTWAYSAPEQLRSSKHVSAAADLYSLGMLLYEALTGDCPFAGLDYAQALSAHETQVPLRVGRVRPGVSLFLEEIVTTLLQKPPSLRFASAGDLAQVLTAGESCNWWQARVTDVDLSGRRRVGKRLRARVRADERFVGREAPLERLLDRERAARDGRGAVVVLEGEAGSGKTRLLAEFVDRSEEKASTVLHGTYRGGAAVRGLEGPMDAILQHFGGRRLEAELTRSLPDSPRQATLLASHLRGETLEDAGDGSPLGAVHAAALGLFRALAQEQPLALLLEDVHDMGVAQAPLVGSLMELAAEAPLLLILTRRPDGSAADPLATAHARHEIETLKLPALGRPEVEQLLVSLLGSRREAADRVLSVHRRTAGNPFFVIAVARGLRGDESGHRSDSGEHSVPDSLRGMLLARTRNLEPSERRLIQLAAVLGSRFDPHGLALTLGEPPLQVLEVLAALERRGGLIHGVGAGFEFEHALLREAIEEDLNEALRSEYHGLIARAHQAALSESSASPAAISGESALLLSHHLLHSREPGEGLVHAPAALDFLFRSGRNHELLILAEKALEVAGQDPTVLRAEIQLKRADCLELLGQREAHHDCAAAALELAQACGEAQLELRALAHLSHASHAKGDTQAAWNLAQRRISLARSTGEALPLARALGAAGRLARLRADREAAEELIGAFLAVARTAGDEDELARAWILGQLQLEADRHAEARSAFSEALRLAREAGRPRTEASALGNLTAADLSAGDLRRAEPGLREHARLSRDLGFRQGRLVSTLNLCHALLKLGRYGEAEDLAVDLFEVADPESSDFRLFAGLFRAMLSLCAGRLGDSGAMLEELRPRLTVASPGPRCFHHEVEVQLALTEARLEDAAHWLADGATLTTGGQDLRARAGLHVGASYLAWARGSRALQREEAQAALDLARELGAQEELAAAAFAMARVHLEAEEESRAIPDLNEAADLVEQQGYADPGPLPMAYLALLAERSVDDVEIGECCPVVVQAEAHLVLFLAGAGQESLSEARRLCDRLSAHLGEADRQRFWGGHPIARAVLDELRGERS